MCRKNQTAYLGQLLPPQDLWAGQQNSQGPQGLHLPLPVSCLVGSVTERDSGGTRVALSRFSVNHHRGVSSVHHINKKAATNCGSLCSSKKFTQGQLQAVSDIGLHQSCSQEAPEPTHAVTTFRQQESTIQLVSQVAYPKGDFGRYQTLLRQILLHVVSTCIAAHKLRYGSILTVSQPERIDPTHE